VSIVVLTNIPTPYRTAFFDAVAAAAARAGKGFHVLYCAKTEPGRHWPYEPAKMRHEHTVLRGFHPSLLGLNAHLNPGVLAALNRLKPDTLIIAGAWTTPTMLAAGLNTYSPAPRRFFWSEGHAGAVLHKSGLIAWLRRRIYRSFDGFAVPNAKSAEWALAQAGEPRQVVTLPNAIDTKFFGRPSAKVRQDARRQLGLAEAGRVLLQVGLLHSAKGAPELARAFLRMRATIAADTVLAFAGSGPAEQDLRDLAAKSHGSLRLLGQLSPQGVQAALWSADVFVLNTRRDSNPLSAIEAAAAGLPIVMSAAAGNVHEIVEAPSAGFVIRDPDDPTEALLAVMAASDEQLAAMASRAFANAQLFDVKAVARSLIEQLYPARPT